MDATENNKDFYAGMKGGMGGEQYQYCFLAYYARGVVSDTEPKSVREPDSNQKYTGDTNQTSLYIKTEESDITREQNADLTNKTRTSTKRDVAKHMNLT